MRDPVFDIMKGIGIVAVIIGHSTVPGFIFKFLFIWHMPLFFIIGGYFFSPKSGTVLYNSIYKSLLFPYLLTSLVIIALTGVINSFTANNIVLGYVWGTLSGSGSCYNPVLFGGHAFIGAIWFLLALAWCRIIYNRIYKWNVNTKVKVLFIIIISYLATVLGKFIYIPTDLSQGTAALVFFCVGNLCRNFRFLDFIMNKKVYFFIISLFLLTIGMMMKPMRMVDNTYQFWPLNVLSAFGGGILVYILSSYLSNFKFGTFMSKIGKISIVILSVHLIDLNIGIVEKLLSLNMFNNLQSQAIYALNIFFHILFSLSIALLLTKFRFISKLFNLNIK